MTQNRKLTLNFDESENVNEINIVKKNVNVTKNNIHKDSVKVTENNIQKDSVKVTENNAKNEVVQIEKTIKIKVENKNINLYDAQFKSSFEKATYISYAKKSPGNFNISTDDINYNIVHNRDTEKFCFIDTRTPYFKFFFDIDFKGIKRKPDIVLLITQEICETICKIITDNVSHEINVDYIFCDKQQFDHNIPNKRKDLSGVHLYFPNIIINSNNAILIVDKLIDYLIHNNSHNLSETDIKSILDKSPYSLNRGLKMIYQIKDNTYYIINTEKSTYDVSDQYPNDNKTKMVYLELTSLKTTKTNINFKHTYKQYVTEEVRIRLRKNISNASDGKDIDASVLTKDVRLLITTNLDDEFILIDTENVAYREQEKLNIKEDIEAKPKLNRKEDTEAKPKINLKEAVKVEPKIDVKVYPKIPIIETPYIIEALRDIVKNRGQVITNITNLLTIIVDSLNKKVRYKYPHWFNLAVCLSKFGQFGEGLLDMFSRSSDKYDLQEIKTIVNKSWSSVTGYTFKSLLMWLKEDTDEILYLDIIKDHKKTINLILNTEEKQHIEFLKTKYNFGDTGIVDIYHKMFKDDIACISKHTYYIYNKNTKLWVSTDDEGVLTHFLDNMVHMMAPLVEHYNILATKSTDKKQQTIYKKLSSDLLSDKKFRTHTSAGPLIKTIYIRFLNVTFLDNCNNKHLLPVQDGMVINLQTGVARERCKEDYFIYEINGKWLGIKHDTTVIDAFIKDIMLDVPELIEYLQRFLGYSISGFTDQCKIAIFYGSGGNGKSLLLALLNYLLGEKYYKIGDQSLVVDEKRANDGSANPQLMTLKNSRIVAIEETKKGSKMNEVSIKCMTGGTKIAGRGLYENPSSFTPEFQVIVATNNKPEFNVDDGMTRRLLLIPFMAQFKDDRDRVVFDSSNRRHRKKIIGMLPTLINHIDEFLVWLVKGSVKFFNDGGFGPIPKAADEELFKYLKQNDTFNTFITDNYIKNPKKSVLNKYIFSKYKEECDPKILQKDFTTLMEDKGYIPKRFSLGIGYTGLGLKEDKFEDEDD
jgi:P4 family phage/plasmid primase-like protien